MEIVNKPKTINLTYHKVWIEKVKGIWCIRKGVKKYHGRATNPEEITRADLLAMKCGIRSKRDSDIDKFIAQYDKFMETDDNTVPVKTVRFTCRRCGQNSKIAYNPNMVEVGDELNKACTRCKEINTIQHAIY